MAINFATTKESDPKATPLVGLAEIVTVVAVLALVIVSLQLLSGAYRGEFSDDEASHYISGLFLKEYFTTFPLQHPLSYLKEFHSRYPFVGIGHWPPLFYGVEAVWMMLFSSSKTAAIALAAAVTLMTSLTLYIAASRMVGRIAGIFAALAFTLAPVVRASGNELMLDIPVALLCLWATLCYARYLDTERPFYAFLFGVMASAALLVKGNSAALALLPAFAILLSGRWDLLRKWSFWLPVPIVLLAVGPWYVFTYGMVEQGFRHTWGLTYIVVSTTENAKFLWQNLGPLILGFAIIGLVSAVVRGGKPAGNGLVAACALFLSVWIFQTVVPAAIQDRYMIPAFPGLIIMAAYGAYAMYHKISKAPIERPVLIGGLFAAMILAPVALRGVAIEPKPVWGFAWAADQVRSQLTVRNPAVLIVANGRGEAAAVAELAMRDPRVPSLFAIRGSRIFGGGGYNSGDYEPRFADVADLMKEVDDYSIPLLILQKDDAKGAWDHIRQVQELLVRYPDRWKLIARNTDVSPEVSVYEIRGNEAKELPTQRMMQLTGPRALTQP